MYSTSTGEFSFTQRVQRLLVIIPSEGSHAPLSYTDTVILGLSPEERWLDTEPLSLPLLQDKTANISKQKTKPNAFLFIFILYQLVLADTDFNL
jgi:hypothetical protein